MNRPIQTLCLFAIAASALSAAAQDSTVTLLLDPNNLAANGWSTTIRKIVYTSSYTYSAGSGAITQVADYGGVGAFKFEVPAMNTAWNFQWAGIGTANLAGTSVGSISSLKLRTLGITGDNPNNWQPPTFMLSLSRGGIADRNLLYVPWGTDSSHWSAPAAHPRASGQWFEFDAATTGTWVCEDTGAKYASWAAVQAAFPNATIATASQLPTSYGYPNAQGVNIGMCEFYDEDRGLFTNTKGEVDWFEFTVNGVTTRYDLGATVPEPGALALLVVGLGLVALRKKA